MSKVLESHLSNWIYVCAHRRYFYETRETEEAKNVLITGFLHFLHKTRAIIQIHFLLSASYFTLRTAFGRRDKIIIHRELQTAVNHRVGEFQSTKCDSEPGDLVTRPPSVLEPLGASTEHLRNKNLSKGKWQKKN